MNMRASNLAFEPVDALAALCKASGDALRLNILRALANDSFGVLELAQVLVVRGDFQAARDEQAALQPTSAPAHAGPSPACCTRPFFCCSCCLQPLSPRLFRWRHWPAC